jgi:hypothetical protein
VSGDGPPPTRPDRDIFASGAYWREYYSSLGHENRVAGEFLLEAATPLAAKGNLNILDAGCGPTVLYWAVFVPGANKIHGFDLNASNILAVQRWIDQAARGQFDEAHLEAASHALARQSSRLTPQQHLRPGGRLALVNVAHGTAWNCDGQRLPLLSVTADGMREKLAALDFRTEILRDVKSTDANWREQGYGNLLLTCATKVATFLTG